MSKMKHLLRKLHIGGGGLGSHQRLVDAPPANSTSPPAIESNRTVAASTTSTSTTSGGADFCFLEEEFQVQLALAISVSDPDVDSAQIDAAKRISLGCSPVLNSPTSDPASVVDSLSLRYWSYNVVNYNEKVLDGFYDVHCVSSNLVVNGNMPSLNTLQLLSPNENCDYEVITVNRYQDQELRDLEKNVVSLSLDSHFSKSMGLSSLVQKIADIVVSRMGGAVSDADEISKKWRMRNMELCVFYNTIILPLGCLDIGLSRHRALLFKVLADKINLPCMLVKGSYYTGTDDGAVNMLQLDDGREYIIDLMGAPGTLIPVEVPCSYLLNTGYFVSGKSTPEDVVELPAWSSNDYSHVVDDATGDERLKCHSNNSSSCFDGDVDHTNKKGVPFPSYISNETVNYTGVPEIGMQHDIICNSSKTKVERPNSVLVDGADWEIPWENLQIGERIGIGSYGEVYLAELNGTEVAVKKFLDQDFSGDALLQFRCEIEIMLRLRHPNVVLFMGAVTRPPNLSILTEYLPRGSLYRLLHRPVARIDEKRRLRMAIDVAKGMNYLHTSQPPVVHRDLKSPNLLVDKNWVVKVCDFGLSRLKHNTFLSSNSTAGTPEWMAPEVLRNEPANEKCDIYSFGVILWELATYQTPWKDLNPMQVVGAVGFQHRRLQIPDFVHPSVSQIIQDCWQLEPHLRPSFAQLIQSLRRSQRLCVSDADDTLC